MYETQTVEPVLWKTALAILVALFAWMSFPIGTAMASPEFLSYESKNSIRDGQGGERKTVDGIDFWMRGDPPRRYQVIGSLTDERHKTGLIGANKSGCPHLRVTSPKPQKRLGPTR